MTFYMLKYSCVFVLISALPIVSYAAESFKFSCAAEKGIGYRFDTDFSGKSMGAEWSQETGFNSDWTFEYPGYGDDVFIDGKPALGFVGNKTVMALEFSENEFGQSLWSYAINLQLDRVVAAQVNTANLTNVSGSMKARAIPLKCMRLD